MISPPSTATSPTLESMVDVGEQARPARRSTARQPRSTADTVRSRSSGRAWPGSRPRRPGWSVARGPPRRRPAGRRLPTGAGTQHCGPGGHLRSSSSRHRLFSPRICGIETVQRDTRRCGCPAMARSTGELARCHPTRSKVTGCRMPSVMSMGSGTSGRRRGGQRQPVGGKRRRPGRSSPAGDDREQVRPGPRHHPHRRVPAAAEGEPAAARDGFGDRPATPGRTRAGRRPTGSGRPAGPPGASRRRAG